MGGSDRAMQARLFNQTGDDAYTLVAALRVRLIPNASEEFLRALRDEIQVWASELQNRLTTVPPPPPTPSNDLEVGEIALDDIELDWSTLDQQWFEVGDQTRLLVFAGEPVEIETSLFNLGDALDLASKSYGKAVEPIEKPKYHNNGRATVRVRASKEER